MAVFTLDIKMLYAAACVDQKSNSVAFAQVTHINLYQYELLITFSTSLKLEYRTSFFRFLSNITPSPSVFIKWLPESTNVSTPSLKQHFVSHSATSTCFLRLRCFYECPDVITSCTFRESPMSTASSLL